MIAIIAERGLGRGEGQCHADGGCKGGGELGNQSWVWRFLKSVLSLPPFLPISIILKDLLTTLDFGVNLHFSWIHEFYFALKTSLILSNKCQPLLWDSYLMYLFSIEG